MSKNKYQNYQIGDYEDYVSMIFDEEKKIIVGIPKEMSEDDVFAAIYEPIISYDIPEFWSRYFRLSNRDQHIIDELMKYVEKNSIAKIHMGKNWEAILYFLHAWGNRTITDLMFELLFDYNDYNRSKSTTKIKNKRRNAVRAKARVRIDNLEKMKKTATFRKNKENEVSTDNLILAKTFCAYNRISPSFIETGTGFFYNISSPLSEDEIRIAKEKYSAKVIKEELVQTGEFDIERFLEEELHLDGKFEKWEIRNLYKTYVLRKESAELVSKLLDLFQQ